ncbi:MAG: DEAD/DEAH box helicase family protein [Tepidisphaeraceae bacterium]
MNQAVVNMIANRLSLRQPQRESLELLSEACDLIGLEKGADLATSLSSLRATYPQVAEFEREFPSLCFSLATGVGKTRLMGAFISYLYKAEGIKHFFVLAPNLTIYNKLIADFTPNTPKYVFAGISDFATNPPEIITGDTYEDGRGVRNEVGIAPRQGRLFGGGTDGPIHINIFNISKINSEVRGDKQPRIKRLHEYIGESYFEYLSKLDDLVLLMDESHRYRASAGVKAINELKPILGLELTATPQIESGKGVIPFKNVVYSYPLSAALKDGFVKEPAVATRENFDAKAYDEDALERLKLEDGVRVHEEVKVQLDVYARDFSVRRVKPFMLVVAKDTEHANALVKLMEDEAFFGGQYKGKVITVHSQTKGEEKDDIVQQLLTVEDPNNPVEIVVHVNMLKEGWDVTNLYTIVPLRTANSRTLVEQSIGRGLRLPYGKRTGVAAVDRLTIVSHDKFQEIIDHANDPNSIIRTGIVIGRDVPDAKSRVVVIESNIAQQLGMQSVGVGAVDPANPPQPVLFAKPEEQKAAQITYQVLKQFERLPSSGDLRKPEVQEKIIEQVKATLAAHGGTQAEFDQFKEKIDLTDVVKKTVDLHIDLSIDIPRIVVVPTGEVTSGFKDFDLDTSTIKSLKPVKQKVLIQNLGDGERFTLESGASIAVEEKLEDYIVRGLIDFPDINYDEHAELLYKLAGQAVASLRPNLPEDDDLLNVLVVHQKLLVQSIYSQMEAHYIEKATSYEVHVSKGFTTMRPVNGTASDEEVRDYRTPVDQKKDIRKMLFGGFKRCLYQVQKFDSDTERRFASILEKDSTVQKWCRPPRDALKIDYAKSDSYEPDFVVEAETCKYVCETKAADEMQAEDVQAKARAAAIWCDNATKHGGGKPWKYMLVPHDAVSDSKTLAGLAATFEVIP